MCVGKMVALCGGRLRAVPQVKPVQVVPVHRAVRMCVRRMRLAVLAKLSRLVCDRAMVVWIGDFLPRVQHNGLVRLESVCSHVPLRVRVELSDVWGI